MARPTVDGALNDLRRRARRLGLVRPLVLIRGFNRALQILMPTFAANSGLLDRNGTDGLDWADLEAPEGTGPYA